MTQAQEDWAALAARSDENHASKVLELAGYVYNDVTGHGGMAHGEGMHIRIGVFGDEGFVELGETFYGTPNEDLKVNTSALTGKLATVGSYRMDSVEAFARHGDKVGEAGPKRWQGGVYHTARVWLPDGVLRTCEIGCAASGVEGSYDAVVAGYAARLLAALWEQRELARFAATAEADVDPEPADA